MNTTTVYDEHLSALERCQNSTIQALYKELQKFNKRIVEEDYEIAILGARKASDYMLRSAAESFQIKAGTKPLKTIIEELRRQKCVPVLIEKHFQILREFGNLAAHGESGEGAEEQEISELTEVEAIICVHALNTVVGWYVAKVMPKVLDIFPFKVISGREITPELISQAAEIDTSVYSSEFRGVLSTCLAWLDRNPDIYTLIIDRNINRVVGYINAMPLEDEAFEAIKGGEVYDIDIAPSDIRTYELPDIYKVYLCSIAVSPNYKGTIAFKMLYEAFFDRLLQLADNDIIISELVADAITSDGEKLAEYIGMRKIKDSSHNSSIYHTTLLPPSIRATSSKAKSVHQLYEKKYEEYRNLLENNQSI